MNSIKTLRSIFGSILLCSFVVAYPSAYAEDSYGTLQINVPNGIAGLDGNGKVTSDINNQNIDTQNIDTQNIDTQNLDTQNIVSQNITTQNVRISTTSVTPSDSDIFIFYNRDKKVDSGENVLQANTLYFASNSGEDHYQFIGSVTATQYRAALSTPSSSSASCDEGEFKDDRNYHYVCVAPNKWKRVALSDF